MCWCEDHEWKKTTLMALSLNWPPYRQSEGRAKSSNTFPPVLWIRDIFVWIRIPNGSETCFSRGWLSRWQPKKVFLLITFWRYFYIRRQKLKNPEEVTKQKKSRVFLLFLLDDGRIRFQILIRTNNGGFGWPNNLRIRIHNTVFMEVPNHVWLYTTPIVLMLQNEQGW